MLAIKLLLFALVITLNCCYCQKSPTYRAAVVEVNPAKNRADVKNQLIDIINSPNLKNVDIIVLPEAILNKINSAILLPNSTVFCDDPYAHPIFHDISCAARAAKMYVVIDVYTKIYCSLDDQSSCANKKDNTNTYNMAIVFDRNGTMIAKYRKFHLWGEKGARTPEKPDLITFQTDFNVTFGVCICFDLLFESPVNKLVDQGVRNFVYPTMWPLELPFMNANQYQQSWAYANNVNLLAANANTKMLSSNLSDPTSGSGIYAGRLTALDIVFSPVPATKILIANVPINLPTITTQSDVEKIVFAKNTASMENLRSALEVDKSDRERYDKHENQEDMELYTIEFLDFTKRLSYNGTICNGEFCCNYDVDVADSGPGDGKPSYSYALAVFSGYRGYVPVPSLKTHHSVCALIACGEMNDRNSCGKRFAMDVHSRYNFKRLSLNMIPPTYRGKNIMPNTLSNDLYPLNTKEFDFKISKLNDVQKYAAKLSLNLPKSDLLTFAIYSRDYQMDKLASLSDRNIL